MQVGHASDVTYTVPLIPSVGVSVVLLDGLTIAH